MNRLKAAALLGALCIAGAASAQEKPADGEEGIVRSGTGSAVPGSPAYFTGAVQVRVLVSPQAPARTSVGSVVFQPGARSNWHTHPAGQSLVVTEGCGWTQREGGPIVRICKGDALNVPAGVKHWHGATATTGMTHLAITETIAGKNVIWLEPVTDAVYRKGPVR